MHANLKTLNEQNYIKHFLVSLFSYFPNKLRKHKFQNPPHIPNLWKTHKKNQKIDLDLKIRILSSNQVLQNM
jgi:hypothetical protein